MGKAMEDMTATAGGKLKQRYGSSPAAIFTFVASLVRTNLECELVQRGGTLQTCVAPRYKLRNECIGKIIILHLKDVSKNNSKWRSVVSAYPHVKKA